MDEEREDDQKKVWKLAVRILLVLAVSGVAVYFIVARKPAGPPPAAKTEEAVKPPVSESVTAPGEMNPLVIPAVGLDQSDSVVREFARALSANARFGQWLQTKELVRKFVVVVDNIANGQSPKPHVDFFSPQGSFKSVVRSGQVFVDEASYTRYDPVSEVFLSLDTPSAVRLYRGLKPLISDAYRDLGYPDMNFEDALVKAMAELLETPVVEGPIRLEKKVLSYSMVDETLENLSQAQKQLLRMGPKNVRMIQGKVRELAAALGIAESRLPRTKVYAARGGRP